MPHLTDAAIAAVLDSSDSTAGASAREHAANCRECQAKLDAARADRRETSDLLRLLDHPVPQVDFAQLIARAKAEQRAERSVGGPMLHRALRWGVGIGMLSTAAIAAALVPNSPFRHVLQSILAKAPAAHRAPAHSAQRAPAVSGVAIVPSGNTIDIVFRATQPSGVIRIVDGASPRVSVRATNAGAKYAINQDTIAVDNRNVNGGEYVVQLPLPAQLSTVRVFIDHKLVFKRVGDKVETSGTLRPNAGYEIPLTE